MLRKLLFVFILGTSQLLSGQNVGIGTSVIDPSAKLQVESTTSGLLPPRMTDVQRNAIVSPAEGLVIYNLTIHCLEYYNGVQWISLCGGTTNCYRNCNEIKIANGASPDGVYTIDPDCAGPIAPMQCYCDMTTDAGGWTLVLNYMHQGGTNPSLNIRATSLPLLGATALGPDESATAFWGHASNSLMNALTFTNVRFYAITSNNPGVIHFKSAFANTINYFKTGIGSCVGMNASFTTLPGHTAFIPGTQNGGLTNQGDHAMTNHPFYQGCTRHWICGISDCTGTVNSMPLSNRRWEADDMVINCCGGPALNVNPNTFHQVWVK